ncbi:hypothetical protein [Rhizobium leguminosarum]|uniref:hypothetical protein n=1 Tax=Rhizobium leguminosarum TaxID=384 RepID=UPI0024B3B45D|nr:hypothetical protein [Rhizobium leguminosarum]WHO78225.1 hypothetical protein QMO81_000876 [Rhizobium leguminosarum]
MQLLQAPSLLDGLDQSFALKALFDEGHDGVVEETGSLLSLLAFGKDEFHREADRLIALTDLGSLQLAPIEIAEFLPSFFIILRLIAEGVGVRNSLPGKLSMSLLFLLQAIAGLDKSQNFRIRRNLRRNRGGERGCILLFLAPAGESLLTDFFGSGL